jgi:hypothetical protein
MEPLAAAEEEVFTTLCRLLQKMTADTLSPSKMEEMRIPLLLNCIKMVS